MSNELTFNISNIFDAKSSKGALQRYDATKYYIAPYQRGYKWESVKQGHVCELMDDFFGAWQNSDPEFYLQFITVKSSKSNGDNVLEVIDGQQRLTTLTILLSVLAHKKGGGQNAISNDLLSYEVRPKVTVFFNNYIYQNIESLLFKKWGDFIEEHPENDEQDIYYMFSAANKIGEMIDETIGKDVDNIREFEEYLLNKVKIILNHIDGDVDCEEIFSNLNDNKVDLTSSELIKGLFLTKSARESTSEREKPYKEIIELRAVMGRQWDELSHWANRKNIKTFFFPNDKNDSTVLDALLLLLAIDDGYKKTENDSKRNALFNYFQSKMKKGDKTAKHYFDTLKEIKSILNEWYNDDDIYNSLGYLFSCKKDPKTTIKNYLPFLSEDKTELRTELHSNIIEILEFDIDEISFGRNADKPKIYNLLLALSVLGNNTRFNFTDFNHPDTTWSLEHIFPQTPEKLPDELGQKDIHFLKSLCSDKLDNYENVKEPLEKEFKERISNIKEVYDELVKKLNQDNCTISDTEKEILYRLIKTGRLHSIGNMALLTGKDNSSNKNGMFDKKRYNIVERISKGSFVPKHTYDVFSKLISDEMNPDLTVWASEDIDAHIKWIKNKIEKITKSAQDEKR